MAGTSMRRIPFYGIDAPVHAERYMSTSLYLCAVNEDNKAILRRWAECCSAAEFNGRGPYPGHGDLRACSTPSPVRRRRVGSRAAPRQRALEPARVLLGVARRVSGRRVPEPQRGWPQAARVPLRRHRQVLVDRASGPGVRITPRTDVSLCVVPGDAVGRALPQLVGRSVSGLPPSAHHLADDLVYALPTIMQVYPPARQRWEELGEPVIDRVLDGIPRWMSLGGGSLSEAMELLSALPRARRYVEIGGYEGGSILAMALRFANRDVQFYSVESFAGNDNGTMDGHGRRPGRPPSPTWPDSLTARAARARRLGPSGGPLRGAQRRHALHRRLS